MKPDPTPPRSDPASWRPMAWLRPMQRLDDRLAAAAQRLRSPSLDRVLVALTQGASYSRLWLTIGSALAVCAGKPGRRAAARGVLAVAIASAVANGPAKLLAGRRRPADPHTPPLIPMPHSTSFPSGHSASAFAFATGAGNELPSLRLPLFGLAAAVAYSRVHTGVHYPSDVAAGVAIGISSGAIAARGPLDAIVRAARERL